ncbi:hypothetical protein PO909_006352 [Leuciscus waleckii]
MAASKAVISGVSLQEVCDAVGWSSTLTSVRFYSLALDAAPGSQALEGSRPSIKDPDEKESVSFALCNPAY